MTRERPLVLVVDDGEANRDILVMRLTASGFDTIQAADGEEALAQARAALPDLILLDVMMPKLDGFEVCRRLKGDASLPFMPIILVTAKSDTRDVVAGLDAGGDEYLTKPIDQAALVARVRSILRMKALHDQVAQQAAQLAEQSAQLAAWNRTLEQRVQEQLGEIERFGRLKRFLSPQVAELVMSSGDEKLLESHRREVTVVFCDLRGFTARAERLPPEHVIEMLNEYLTLMSNAILDHGGTLVSYQGDGIMAVFGAPLEQDDHADRAMAAVHEMLRERLPELNAWVAERSVGEPFSIGIGVCSGPVMSGNVGSERRMEYAAVGDTTNTAARLQGLTRESDHDVLVADATRAALTRPVPDLVPVGALDVRGRQVPAAVWTIESREGATGG
jgi:adenylate cyclase